MQEQKKEDKEQPVKQPELKQYDMETLKIQPFDETMVGYMKTMQEQNNIYAGLRTQEEQLRVNLNTIRGAIHELKRMRPEELREIQLPWLNGLRRITPDRRNEIIKGNIEMYHSLEIQYKSLCMQRLNRADELGEARLRVLKRLWDIMISEHKMKQEDLIDMIDHKATHYDDIGGRPQAMVRSKTELPTAQDIDVQEKQ